MFCANCGAQIPDNNKFCNHCGAKQETAVNVPDTSNETQNQQMSADKTTQQTKKASKKKVNILLIVIIFLGAGLLGRFVIAPSMTPDAGDQGSTSQQSGQNNGGSSSNVPNAAYEAVFDDTYIVHFQSFFNMDMASFALKQNNGIICCADYGYENDVVKQWVETMYVPVSEYTDTQKADLEYTMKNEFSMVDALSCCSVSYQMGVNYFTITCTYSDVDKAAHYSELYNAGILQMNNLISMSGTEETLLNQGFIKK